MMMRHCLLLGALAGLVAVPAYGACTNPTGNETDIKYNGDYHTYQFCNGTSWLAYGGGSNCAATGNYAPTTPSGQGYFVLTSTTYNGNMGGIVGADANCLTELTTNTGWMGYSTANSNGQLVAAKVHAFICIGLGDGGCNNLMPLTTYYFANAVIGAAGGASFTTDSNGLGPNDSANWGAANYFSGTYTYWADRARPSNTQWASGGDSSSGVFCNGLTSTGGASNRYGNSNTTTSSRWNTGLDANCSTSYPMICFVNP